MLTESSSNNFMNLEVETNMSGRKHCIWSPDSSESSFVVGGVRTCCLKIRGWMTEEDLHVILPVGMTRCRSAPPQILFLDDSIGSAHILGGFWEHANHHMIIT